MKIRSIALILITLVIGVILGMLTSAQLRFHKLKPVRVYFSEERFREGFYKMIQPDEAQKAEIEAVINKHAKGIGEMQIQFRKEFDDKMKAFRKELDSKLTREQLDRIKEMDKKREEMIRKGRRDRDSLDGDYDRRRGDRPYRQGPPPASGDSVRRGRDM